VILDHPWQIWVNVNSCVRYISEYSIEEVSRYCKSVRQSTPAEMDLCFIHKGQAGGGHCAAAKARVLWEVDAKGWKGQLFGRRERVGPHVDSTLFFCWYLCFESGKKSKTHRKHYLVSSLVLRGPVLKLTHISEKKILKKQKKTILSLEKIAFSSVIWI